MAPFLERQFRMTRRAFVEALASFLDGLPQVR